MITLGELASIVKGKVIGAPDIVIKGVSDIKNGAPDTIAFLFNPKLRKLISDTSAKAIIVPDAKLLGDKSGIVVANPRLAMAKVLTHFESSNIETGIHPTAIISESADIGNDVNIGAFTIIGENTKIDDNSTISTNVSIGNNVTIGSDTVVNSHVAINSKTTIGNNVIIDNGSVIGSCGYGFETDNDVHHKIPQIGSVNIEDNVEIGANCTIDRGTIEETIIGEGSKFDNMVHIAHNVKIGKRCLLMAQVGIAGGTVVGDYCIFAGQAGAKDNINIGDRAIFVAKAGATKSLPGNIVYAGMPAREISENNKRDASYLQIVSLKKRLKNLEEKFDK